MRSFSPYLETDEELLIVLGDTIIDYDLKSILSQPHSLLGVKKVDDPRNFGVVELDQNGFIIIYAILKLPANEKIISRFNLKYWGLWAVLTLTIISLKLFSGLDYRLYGQVIVTGISAGLISLILTSWLTKRNTN